MHRDPGLRITLAVLMLATPFVLLAVSPLFGAQRGVWVALLGVGLGIVFELPFKPYNITYPRWVGREHWTEVALVLGMMFGMILSIAEALVTGVALVPFAERIWVPIYRVVLFSGGLTLLRHAVWQIRRGNRNRGRMELGEMPASAVKPALPRVADAPQRGGRPREM